LHLLNVANGGRATLLADASSHYEQSPIIAEMISRTKVVIPPTNTQLVTRAL
jgi:hypothetical protein